MLQEILQSLKAVRSDINKLHSEMEEIKSQVSKGNELSPHIRRAVSEKTLDAVMLLSLPDHLRKTALAVFELGKATASEVAQKTSRTRAIESSYLNQLIRMGSLRREKRGREVYFSLAA